MKGRFSLLMLVLALVVMAACSERPAGNGLSFRTQSPAAGTDDVLPTVVGTAVSPRSRLPQAPLATVNVPIEVMIGQMLMVGIDDTIAGIDAQQLITELHVGNVVLLDRNVVSPSQISSLTRDLQWLAYQANGAGLFIAVDQEGGTVQRLRADAGFTRLPDAATVGAAGRPDLARELGRMAGKEMRAVGVNMSLGPVLDVNDNPRNPVIGRRAFGATADAVELAGVSYLSGLQESGVVAVAKHFPGHGSTGLDSHFALPIVNKPKSVLDASDLRPFRAAITAGVGGVMTAHVAYPSLDASGDPATISSPILRDLLRFDMAFSGLVITDDMGMGKRSRSRWNLAVCRAMG